MKILLPIAALMLLVSCRKHHEVPKMGFANVVILGNSITYSPANPGAGWTGSWGMAASVADSDYVHLLTKKLQSENRACKVSIKNISAFERDFANYAITDSLKALHDLKPDMLILRIGENVPDGFDPNAFEKRYADLIDYFKTDNPNIKIVAAGSIWIGKDGVDEIMKKHSAFIALSPLSADQSIFAWGQFTDIGIQQHPNDKGMREIANSIWDQVQVMR